MLVQVHVAQTICWRGKGTEASVTVKSKKKSKATLVTGLGGTYGCEMSRPPYFLGSWLTDGSEVVSLMHRLRFTPQEDSWYSFPLEAE
jgi:hypothetical protein